MLLEEETLVHEDEAICCMKTEHIGFAYRILRAQGDGGFLGVFLLRSAR